MRLFTALPCASLRPAYVLQEGIERVLQVCLRFIAFCRLSHQQEEEVYSYTRSGGGGGREQHTQRTGGRAEDPFGVGVDADGRSGRHRGTRGDHMEPSASSSSTAPSAGVPIILPPEELEAIHKEFFSHVSYLFQIMPKVENRGFMFRLDFNGFLSSLTTDMAAVLTRI